MTPTDAVLAAGTTGTVPAPEVCPACGHLGRRTCPCESCGTHHASTLRDDDGACWVTYLGRAWRGHHARPREEATR